MGADGWMTHNQTNIETLYLITGCACNFSLEAIEGFVVDLSPYRNLRSFSWIGLLTRAEIDQARLVLEHNANRLEHLELDFTYQAAYVFDDRIADITSQIALGGTADVLDGPRFPRITSLCLSNISLYSTDFLRIFEWNKLTSLTIRDCPGLRGLLEMLAEDVANTKLNLKTLDFVVNALDANGGEAWAIIDFLRSFTGLVNLYMHVEAILDDGFDAILKAVNNHKDTLRRLSYEIVRWHDNVIAEYPESIGTMGISEAGVLDRASTDNPLTRLDLDCLGLAATPDVMVRNLYPASYI
jgi:hypothetical protein